MTSFYTYDKDTLDTKFADKLGTSDTAASAASLTDAGLTAVFASTACSQHDSDIASTASGGSVTNLASLFSSDNTALTSTVFSSTDTSDTTAFPTGVTGSVVNRLSRLEENITTIVNALKTAGIVTS